MLGLGLPEFEICGRIGNSNRFDQPFAIVKLTPEIDLPAPGNELAYLVMWRTPYRNDVAMAYR